MGKGYKAKTIKETETKADINGLLQSTHFYAQKQTNECLAHSIIYHSNFHNSMHFSNLISFFASSNSASVVAIRLLIDSFFVGFAAAIVFCDCIAVLFDLLLDIIIMFPMNYEQNYLFLFSFEL